MGTAALLDRMGVSRRRVLAGALAVVAPLGGGGDSVSSSFTPPAPMPPYSQELSIGVRQLGLRRGADRPLRTLVWSPAAGRHPLVLFSHGLHGTPEGFESVAASIAAAGFVVAAPAYPYTNGEAPSFSSDDMPNQPADASYVISEILGRDLAGHIDAARIGAAGHSAGGFTTAGLLSGRTRDARIAAAVIIAGGPMNGDFTGPAAAVLFVHGDADPIVPFATARRAYDRVPWSRSKAFLTMIGADHDSYLWASDAAAANTMRDFLRWSLRGDGPARRRLRADGTVAGSARIESAL